MNKENNLGENEAPIIAKNCLVAGVVIKGDINSKTDITISGELNGNLTCTQTAIISNTGIVHGNVNANDVIVQGVIKGQAQIAKHTHIKETGTIKGKVITNKLILEDGASFGKITFAPNPKK